VIPFHLFYILFFFSFPFLLHSISNNVKVKFASISTLSYIFKWSSPFLQLSCIYTLRCHLPRAIYLFSIFSSSPIYIETFTSADTIYLFPWPMNPKNSGPIPVTTLFSTIILSQCRHYGKSIESQFTVLGMEKFTGTYFFFFF
jgi:hypothetical protein